MVLTTGFVRRIVVVHGHLWVEENRRHEYFMIAVFVGVVVACFPWLLMFPGGVSVAAFDALAALTALPIAFAVVIWRRYLRMHTATAASPGRPTGQDPQPSPWDIRRER